MNTEFKIIVSSNKKQLSLRGLNEFVMSNFRQDKISSLLQLLTITATSIFLFTSLFDYFVKFEHVSGSLDNIMVRGELNQLLWILSISLVVCLISILTNMLFVITKQFREIGTLKCLGALDNTILKIFILMGVVMGFIASVIGVMVGMVIQIIFFDYLILSTLQILDVVEIIGYTSAATIIIVTSLSFLGAVLPAYRASKMLPIEAMKYNA